MITAAMDDSRLNARIEEYADALIASGRDSEAANIVADESRLFLRDVMRFTPPKTKQQGEDAVKRDLKQIFTAVDEMLLNTIGSEHGVSNIHAFFEKKDKTPQEVNWDRLDPTGAGMESFHKANRNRRGRARKLKRDGAGRQGWYAPYVVSREVFAAYRDKLLARVGYKKAAWAISFQKLGGRLPRWIVRHISYAKGRCIDELATPGKPSVTMASFAPGVGEDARAIQAALKTRYNSIGRKLRLLRDGITGDWNHGVRFAKKHPGLTGASLDFTE